MYSHLKQKNILGQLNQVQGMTAAGVARYRRENPGSKLKTAVTGKVKPGSKAAKRRKSFCARSAGQMKKFPKAAKDPNSRLRQARRRWFFNEHSIDSESINSPPQFTHNF